PPRAHRPARRRRPHRQDRRRLPSREPLIGAPFPVPVPRLSTARGNGNGNARPAKPPSFHPPQRKPRSDCFDRGHTAPSPESGSACFLVRLGGRFLVPALRSGTGVARRGGQGRAQARPQGLSLTAPSTAP